LGVSEIDQVSQSRGSKLRSSPIQRAFLSFSIAQAFVPVGQVLIVFFLVYGFSLRGLPSRRLVSHISENVFRLLGPSQRVVGTEHRVPGNTRDVGSRSGTGASAKSHSSRSVKKQELHNRITLVILTSRQLKILFLAGVVKFDSWDFNLGYRKV
jgi:hypothetical protein